MPPRKRLIDKGVQCPTCYGVCGEGLEDDKQLVFVQKVLCVGNLWDYVLLFKRWREITTHSYLLFSLFCRD